MIEFKDHHFWLFENKHWRSDFNQIWNVFSSSTWNSRTYVMKLTQINNSFIDTTMHKKNLVYYRAYMTLRLNHAGRLIAYFYYSKYAKLDDKIKFRHFDQSIFNFLKTNHKTNIIQNNLFLDDKIVKNCIIIFWNIHNYSQNNENK